MPYNTRRKSLSLPSLGIHVPVTHASRAAAAAAAAANRASPSSATNSPRSPSVANMATSPASAAPAAASPLATSRDDARPSKKLKRVYSDSEDSDSAHPSEPRPKQRRDDAVVKFEHTPPPSPPANRRPSIEMDDADVPKTIDLDSINDEIVEAVVVQLQNTGNRPHLVKELAAVLMQQLKIVQQSANPCAIISSRLSTYLKRSCWSAASPCPLAKELETVHPRRTYFYLTTCPHQPLPDPAHAATLSQLAHTRTIISPSLSSAASASEDADMERRRELSPSPEVDLSSPEFDDMDDDIAMPSTPIGSLSLRGFASGVAHLRGHHGSGHARPHRAASPPLEKDEKEFTQTADGLQKRKLSGNLLSAATPEQATTMDIDFGGKDDSGLFGEKMLSAVSMTGISPMSFVTSPAIRPAVMSLNLGKRDGEFDSWTKLDQLLEWDRSPENIELDELDGLLNDF